MPLARTLSVGLVALVTLAAACSSWTPPAPPPQSAAIPPGPDDAFTKGKKKPKKAPTADERFASVRDRIFDHRLDDQPSKGRELGLHRYDGKVAAYSAVALKARFDRAAKDRVDLAVFDKEKLSPDSALDLAILEGEIDQDLFRANETLEHKKRPQFYEELFSVNTYLDRDYGPIEERVSKLLAHEKAAIAEVPHIKENLAGPLSKPVVETTIKIFKGYAEYLRNDVPKQVKGVGNASFQEDLAKTNEALAKEAASLADWLEKTELPRGDSSHILGPERFKKLLKAQEGLNMPLADLKKMGEENLQVNKKAYEKLAGRVVMKRPKVTELFALATEITEKARKFVVEKHFATIPTDEKLVVKETPPFQRWNSAFLDPPGPFEPKATNAFYYITLPDPKWSKKEQDDYLMPFPILLTTTIHETYPGHFLQGLWIKKAPTRIQKSIGSYSFIEGWAHYIEQAMLEQGFGSEDPANQLGQLSDALLRNCRLVVSLGIHTEGMTLNQAEQRFMNDCKQDKATAREQAVRGTFDPGYFAYTLGKVQILALREEAKKKLGAKFDLQKFHDALLSHGSPPVPLIHDRVLAEIGAAQ